MITNTISLEELKNLSCQLPQKIPYLTMLVLFGSQARGDIHTQSDWDFAALYDQDMRKKHCESNAFSYFEVPSILGEIFNLNSDHIDVVDLNNCSKLISHFVARDGKLIYETTSGQFDKFKQLFLINNQAIKAINKNLHNEVNQFLAEWGVV